MADFDLLSSLSASPALALPFVFGAGVLTSLTPCIYPMIPITAAVVGSHATGAAVSRARSLALTLTYVLGLALVYALLGLLAGLSGSVFGGVSSSPWASIVMGNLLLLFALMMLDVVPVPVPHALLARSAALQGGGRFAATFVMGAASGLVAAPCGAPVMGAVLGWVADTRNAALGFAYLFVFSLGMCAVLVAVGFSAGAAARLPRAGVWMLRVKRAFAVVMLGAAEYYLVGAGRLLI